VAHLYVCAESGPFTYNQELTLTGDEARHAVAVARLQVGEKTLVTDGSGHHATVLATSVNRATVSLVVQSAEFHPTPQPELWLAQALAKGGRDEAAIQMACELGVEGVIPLQAKRCVSQWRDDKVAKGVERWQKILLEATKQSLRSWIPRVLDPLDIDGIGALAPKFQILVLDPEATMALRDYQPTGDTPVLVVVGPEGGLAPEEIDHLVSLGAVAARLGSTVLRTSTAGPAALAVLNVKLGRW
jgi:16S rRNA (uracil1498-N3)-methyltransferase